jgi:hypothetical protein
MQTDGVRTTHRDPRIIVICSTSRRHLQMVERVERVTPPLARRANLSQAAWIFSAMSILISFL